MRKKLKPSEISKYLVLKDYHLYLALEIEHNAKEIARLEKKNPELVEMYKDDEEEVPVPKIYRIKPIEQGHLYIEFEGAEKKSGVLHYNTMDYEFTSKSRSLSNFLRAFTDIDCRQICWHIPATRGRRIFKIPVEELLKMVKEK